MSKTTVKIWHKILGPPKSSQDTTTLKPTSFIDDLGQEKRDFKFSMLLKDLAPPSQSSISHLPSKSTPGTTLVHDHIHSHGKKDFRLHMLPKGLMSSPLQSGIGPSPPKLPSNTTLVNNYIHSHNKNKN